MTETQGVTDFDNEAGICTVAPYEEVSTSFIPLYLSIKTSRSILRDLGRLSRGLLPTPAGPGGAKPSHPIPCLTRVQPHLGFQMVLLDFRELRALDLP
jgi:hypothetical protein